MEMDHDSKVYEEEANKTIYPDVRVHRDEHNIRISTSLRKEHNGEYYYWEFLSVSHYPKVTLDELEFQLGKFHEEVYRVIIEGIVDPSLTEIGFSKEPLFKKSISQLSESERLKLKYQPALFSTENLDQLKKIFP